MRKKKVVHFCCLRAAKGFHAFSLVEMLMALLVASLLLAALAPVMTRKFGSENIVISGTGRNTVEHFQVFDDASKNGTDENKFVIPSNAVNVRISMVGGGGAGGSATFGSKTITANENNWKVPDGVKKIRVYMVGGGGGGASGGVVLAHQLGQLKAGSKDFKNGSTSFSFPDNKGGGIYWNQSLGNVIVLGNQDYLPTIDKKCEDSGYKNWENNLTQLSATVTGCGAGGAGGGGYSSTGGGGGSGAYKTETVTIPSMFAVYIPGYASTGTLQNASSSGFLSGAGGGGGSRNGSCTPIIAKAITSKELGLSLIVSGGNGGLGSCRSGTPTQGSNGTGGSLTSYGGGNLGSGGMGGRGSDLGGGGGGGNDGCDLGGGGGGGAAVIYGLPGDGSGTYMNQLFIVSGGGGGGGTGGCSNIGAGGGGGGGPYGGGGGGGGGYQNCSSGGGAGGGSKGGSGGKCGECNGIDSICYGGNGFQSGGGEGGGGWPNGVSGKHPIATGTTSGKTTQIGEGGKLSANTFGDNYCNGGNSDTNGKPGAIRISWAATNNALKCKYNTQSNGGSGGGGGQVWIGEIDVVGGEYLNFHIGQGGGRQNSYSSNGNNGGNTYITRGSGAVVVSVSGGEGGKYTTAANPNAYYGNGRGINSSGWNDWTGVHPTVSGGQGGLNGSGGNTASAGGGGGKGGSVYFKDGVLMDGGSAGNSQTNGSDASNYGAGGGGGGGVVSNGKFPGYGGAGGSGYIYIEWGDTNGGGGSSGEIKEKQQIVSAVAGATVEITIGKGGVGSPIEYDDDTKYKKGNKGGDGGDTVIKVKNKNYSAKGGIGGSGGGMTSGEHGMGGSLTHALGSVGSNSKFYDGGNGIDGFGGKGASAIYEFAANGEGIGGCGGNATGSGGSGSSSSSSGNNSGACGNGADSAVGKNGINAGSGGGGGAMKNSVPHIGGNGGDGAVLIEWEEFREENQ